MKLYGSLNNRLMEGVPADKQPTPEVGMGVTILSYSDRHVGTISRVESPNKFYFREDSVRHDQSKPGGMGHQNWLIEPNPTAAEQLVTLRKDGKYHVGAKLSGAVVLLGRRDYRYDWEF